MLESLEDRTLPSVTVHPLYQLERPAGSFTPLAGSSPSGYTPSQVRQAYGVNAIQFAGGVTGDGSGQTIAIVDAYDDPTIQSDLNAFSSQYGLPTTSSGLFSFTKVNQTGGSTLPAGNTSWAVEESLDVEWAHAIAPKANIVLVESTDNGNNIFAAVSYAASIPGVSVVSMSFGGSEWSSETGLDGSTFVTPSGHANVSFVASSGDSGAPPEFPSASPNVLGVGGTALNLDGSGNYLGESGWSGSGGGVSAYESQPSYQAGIVTQSSTQRTSPDVAYDASPSTGFAVYDSYTYGAATPWQQIGGTSAGAPQWSALVAIADQGRALEGLQPLDGPTQLLPAVYGLPASDFHDVTTGSSSSGSGGPSYSAGAGYDLVTGRGSPLANLVVPALAAYGTSSPAATTTTLSSGTNPSAYGQAVTFTATVRASAGTPSGAVTFMLGGTTLGTGTLTNGTAALTTAALPTGVDGVTAVYGGSSSFAGSTSAALTQTVNKDSTATSVASSADPSVSGQSVTFTATVRASAPGAGTPTGTVTFYDGSATLGTATLSGSSAAFSTSALAAGSHSITAGYGGDGNFAAGTSAVLTQTVNTAAASLATTTSVKASANPSVYGQRVTFTATVKPGSGTGTPTGTVTFLDGTTALGTATLGSGVASFATSALGLGGHSITASYGGDAAFAGSTSAALAQTVKQATSTASLKSSANPSVFGQSVTFTATIRAASPGSGTPTGTVSFLSGSTVLGTVTLVNGVATFSTATLPVGAPSVTVRYGGDAHFLSSSSTLTQTVNAANTVTAVKSSAVPSATGQAVTFTATVTAKSPGVGTPTGTVTLLDGTTTLGTATLVNGVATFSTASLAAGSHSITVIYGGDGNFKTSTSAALSQTVNATAPAVVAATSVGPATAEVGGSGATRFWVADLDALLAFLADRRSTGGKADAGKTLA